MELGNIEKNCQTAMYLSPERVYHSLKGVRDLEIGDVFSFSMCVIDEPGSGCRVA